MTRPVKLSQRAQGHIRKARAWWLANRDKAPTAFDDDLGDLLQILANNPEIGVPTPSRRTKGVRRVPLPRLGLLLFYKLSRDGTVLVLAVWYAGRQRMPSL